MKINSIIVLMYSLRFINLLQQGSFNNSWKAKGLSNDYKGTMLIL